MWEWLGSNFDKIGSIGKFVGGVGQAYGAIEQSKIANKMFDFQKQNMDREVSKENQAQANLDSALTNVYGDKKKKNSAGIAQFDLGV